MIMFLLLGKISPGILLFFLAGGNLVSFSGNSKLILVFLGTFNIVKIVIFDIAVVVGQYD